MALLGRRYKACQDKARRGIKQVRAAAHIAALDACTLADRLQADLEQDGFNQPERANARGKIQQKGIACFLGLLGRLGKIHSMHDVLNDC